MSKNRNSVFDYPEDAVVRKLGRLLHEDHVKNLMAQLQSPTFTTEQYRQFIDNDLNSKFERMARFSYPIEYARKCLEGFKVVREVEPDVWGLLF